MRLTLILIVLLHGAMFAQNCKLRLEGSISDFHSSERLAGAKITHSNGEVIAFSDSNGNFSLQGLCPGLQHIQFEHEDCETKTLHINPEEVQELVVFLEHHIDLDEVRLKGDTKTQKTGIEQSLQSEDLNLFRNQEMALALRSLSGVDAFKTGNTIAKPIIHGLHSSRVVMLNNGVRQEDQEWGVEHSPSLDLNAYNEIKVVQGSAALRYGGDAVGGIILGLEQTPRDSLWRGSVYTKGETNGRGGSLGAALGRKWKNDFYLKTHANYLRKGDLHAPDYVLSNTGQERFNASLSVGQKHFEWGWSAYYSLHKNELGILAASHIGNLRDLAAAIASDRPTVLNPFTYEIESPRQEIVHHLAKASFYKRFKGVGKLEAQYAYQSNQRQEFDRRRNQDDNDRAAVDLLLQSHALQFDFQADAKSDIKWQTGISGGYQINEPNPATGIRRLIPDYEKYTAGAYINTEKKVGNWLFDVGLRLDFSRYDAQKFYDESDYLEREYDRLFPEFFVRQVQNQVLLNPVLNFWNPAALLGVKYNFSGGSLLFNYGLTSRAPNPAELFSDGLHHSAAIIELGDLQLDAETSHKFSFEVQKDIGKHSFRISPYFQLIQNFINQIPTGAEQTIRGAFPVWSYLQTDATLVGFDADWSYRFNEKLNLTTNVAYVYGQDRRNDVPLILMPPLNAETQLNYKNDKWLNFKANLGLRYSARQNRFPDFNFPISFFDNGTVQEQVVDVSTPPDSFFVGNLAVSIQPTSNLELLFQIDNLGNTAYRNYLNRLRFFADDVGSNFSLQLTYSF